MGWIAVRKISLSNKNLKARLEWSKMPKMWDININQGKIVSSDETKIELNYQKEKNYQKTERKSNYCPLYYKNTKVWNLQQFWGYIKR